MILAHDRLGAVGRPSVVLLHAGVADRRMWDPQWAALGARFDVVRADLRGFGESPLPAESYRSADDVVGLLDHLGIAQAALVGASYGGRVALDVASAHHDRVQRLVLLCPSVRGMRRAAALEQFSDSEDALIAAGDVAGAVALNVRTWLGPEASEEVGFGSRSCSGGHSTCS
jgi:pimeloyl-ACP methyl ester carboxylesterase